MPRNASLLLLLACHCWSGSLVSIPLAAAHSHHDHHDHHDHRHLHNEGNGRGMGCGTEAPTRESLVRDEARLNHRQRRPDRHGRRRAQFASCNDIEPQSIEIKTYFHFMAIPVADDLPDQFIIPHPSDVALSQGPVEDYTTYDEMVEMCQRQVEIMNDAFQGTPFYYTFQPNPSVSTNLDFTNSPMDFQNEMREEFGVKHPTALNIYLSFALGSQVRDTRGYLGVADFPSFQLKGDGLFMRYDVLPEGGLTYNDDGYIAVHELGHFHGLLHPWSNVNNRADVCDSANANDFVRDTPAIKAATSQLYPDATCTDFESGNLPDSCPDQSGKDPVFNFMNYVQDRSCMPDKGEFTCGQIERMYQQWILYRDRTTGCDSEDEMEIEVFILFDKMFHALENSFFLQNMDTKEKIFDSEVDFLDMEVLYGQDSMLVDLCVPKAVHRFVFNDDMSNGFSSGASYFEVLLDGISIEKVSGNFGSQKVVVIDPPLTTASIQTPTSPPVAPIATNPTTPYPTDNPPSTKAPTRKPTRPPVAITDSPSSAPTEASASPTDRPSSDPTPFPVAVFLDVPSFTPVITTAQSGEERAVEPPAAVQVLAPSLRPVQNMLPNLKAPAPDGALSDTMSPSNQINVVDISSISGDLSSLASLPRSSPGTSFCIAVIFCLIV